MLELRARRADANCLCLRGLQLRLSRDHVRASGGAGIVLVQRDLQRSHIMRGGIIEQRLHRVRPAQLEIVAGKRGLRRQTRIGQIGLARLRTRHVALDRPPESTPYVEIPTGIGCQIEVASQLPCAGGTKRRPATPGGAEAARAALVALPPSFANVNAGNSWPRASSTTSCASRYAASNCLSVWLLTLTSRSRRSSRGSSKIDHHSPLSIVSIGVLTFQPGNNSLKAAETGASGFL